MPRKAILRVEGLSETYAVLAGMQPEMTKQTIKRMKTEARPIVQLLRRNVPDTALSGWRAPTQTTPGVVQRGSVSRFPRYDARAIRRKTNLSVRNLRSRRSGKRDLFVSFASSDPASTPLDMSGKRSKNRFTENMTSKLGAPSRIMWPTVEARLTDITIIVTRAKNDMEKAITEQLNRQGYTMRGSKQMAAKSIKRGAGAFG